MCVTHPSSHEYFAVSKDLRVSPSVQSILMASYLLRKKRKENNNNKAALCLRGQGEVWQNTDKIFFLNS